ncbi:hypothetical protein MJO28_009153 [Puccinia striiformis f. sp. tritici]|uniref:Uncharacterized protein n=1 Tax=Puccinia striiformis f. sp. tritici TaxID=168172 RepID=A0ACC0E7X7_9BASI|nr:hypothetical protein MJO28_009153 [Puccinia striiformis f. sp. tritici]KAI7950417.1 hypothetical protein MJO29_009091 [Puccinia striiformis f. sp. tritici]
MSLFKTLQFTILSAPGAKLVMITFLSDLELEIKRSVEPLATASAVAMTVQRANEVARQYNSSRSNTPASSGQRPKNPRRICENGVHNPATSHTAENCHQLHPERAIAYHQAALDRLNTTGVNPKAGLSVLRGICDAIVLDSGASGHYLKHREYFLHLTPLDSAVFAANGSSIPIVGRGPAVIHTSIGPLHIEEAFFAPELSNSLIPLTKYLQQGFSLIPTHDGSRFE